MGLLHFAVAAVVKTCGLFEKTEKIVGSVAAKPQHYQLFIPLNAARHCERPQGVEQSPPRQV